ncbi:hypothetical protein HC256_007876 [Beauveria bassiana]|nr:hypothetical protein HC256_007876 [Beauveria bassiana]
MAVMAADRMRQIHLGLGSAGYAVVSRDSAEQQQQQQLAIFAQEHEAHEEILLAQCPQTVWPQGSYRASCPRPILVTKQHCDQLLQLHGALTAAINDIVPRWWRDTEARFPQRMPLAAEEEDLLKWLDEQQDLGHVREYSTCQGSWRPDFLIEEVRAADGTCAESFRVSEINARFCFNGFMHIAYGSAALADMGTERSGLVAATDGEQFLDGLLGLFQHDKPLHLLKGEERGMDIQMFVYAVQQRLGTAPRLITPADLRLAPDAHGRTTLCCLASPDAAGTLLRTAAGELVEEIHQVGLELRQHELLQLDRDVWRHLSLRCFNDMRTVLLVHDKRMLGIVLQELDNLVARGVLTPAQAAALDRGIAHTILPGSPELQTLIMKKNKDEYILKPVRGGKGAGIVFGEEMSVDEWRAAVERLRLRRPVVDDEAGLFVVQRKVEQIRYDVVLKKNGEVGRFPLVGTYHVVNGRYLGIGIWRSSAERICAVSTGGSWMCSVMTP